jgi:hypothetical protein
MYFLVKNKFLKAFKRFVKQYPTSISAVYKIFLKKAIFLKYFYPNSPKKCPLGSKTIGDLEKISNPRSGSCSHLGLSI